MTSPVFSSNSGANQPPKLKPPIGSSCGPPGDCMTPSRLMKAPTTIFLTSSSLGDYHRDDPRTTWTGRIRHSARNSSQDFRQCRPIARILVTSGRAWAGRVNCDLVTPSQVEP
ncbi:hypothetical protein chiPu_0031510 [Chiloscyllium punctatum]|uniref:Uncharacterized protein n=1 Tax=Chiloscyllium punctatum TaxID=137246 RepID=A0A401TXK8_CHIPU|nr:hypothetical protein [Chiloscyllium punctatum]